MARFHELPLSLFDREARPYIQRLNRELRDLFALEGSIKQPRDIKRSDSTVARIADRQVHVSRITPSISSTVAGTSTVTGVPNLTFSTTDAKGTTSTVIAVDSTIALFDDGQSDVIGNSAAVGEIAYAARRDHTHSLGANAFGTSSVLVGLSAINGSNLTALRSDSALALDQTIAPTWTGSHTFSLESTHNGGVDLGTSGRLDSNVADAVGAVSFKLQPSVALTSGTDRWTHRFLDTTGTQRLGVRADGTINLHTGSDTGGLITVSGGINQSDVNFGILFYPTFGGETPGGALGFNSKITDAIAAAQFETRGGSGSATYTQAVGGIFTCDVALGQSNSGTLVDKIGGYFKVGMPRKNDGSFTNSYGIYVDQLDNKGAAKVAGTVTNSRGIYIAANEQGNNLVTNCVGLEIEEESLGATTNMEILLQGGGEIFFRDSALSMGSDSDGHLHAKADTAFQIDSAINATATTVTSSTHTAAAEHVILCDTTSNAITVNLPAASSSTGRMYRVKIINATNNVTIDGNGAETIDGSTTVVLNTLYDSIDIACDGSNWFIV